MAAKRTKGFWVIVIMGKLLLLVLIIGQMMAFIDYDFTVSIGLQESKDIIGEMGVAVNKGFGAGDTIIYTPTLVIGLIGLWFRRMWGVFAMAGALAITAYWPMVSIFILIYAKDVPEFNFTNYTAYTAYSILLSAITIYGIWGMWYLYKNRKILAYEE